MREQAEQHRPCFDENVLGKEWLNSVLWQCGCISSCCCSCSALGFLPPRGSSRLHRERAAGREGCLHQACIREFTGSCGALDREAVA